MQYQNWKLEKEVYWLLGLVIGFLILKGWHHYASLSELNFLLFPTQVALQLLTGSTATYIPESGYFFSDYNILIDQSCSGFNWFLLAFLLSSGMTIQIIQDTQRRLLTISGLLVLSYGLTLLVNTTRIIFSLSVEQYLLEYTAHAHLIQGVFVYLSFLLLWQLSCSYFLHQLNRNYESLT